MFAKGFVSIPLTVGVLTDRSIIVVVMSAICSMMRVVVRASITFMYFIVCTSRMCFAMFVCRCLAFYRMLDCLTVLV